MVDDGYGTPKDLSDMDEAHRQENPLKVIIMRGPSGSGKSTWIKKNHPEATVCSADNFFINSEGEYVFDPTELGEAHQECFQAFLGALYMKRPLIVVDNTSLRWWEYMNYVAAANMQGAEVHIVQFVPTTLEELKLCCKRGKHGTPSQIVAMQGWNFEDKPREEDFDLFRYEISSLTIVPEKEETSTPTRDAVEAWFEGKSHWDEHPDYEIEDWRHDVRNHNTCASYKEWCLSEAEGKDLENVT
jgi:predicted kinase